MLMGPIVYYLSTRSSHHHTIIARSRFGQSCCSRCIMISCPIFHPIFATLRPTSRPFGLTIMGRLTSRSISLVARTRGTGNRRRHRLGRCERLLGHRMRLRLCLITVQSTFIEISNQNGPSTIGWGEKKEEI